jgi:hypothetical protein
MNQKLIDEIKKIIKKVNYMMSSFSEEYRTKVIIFMTLNQNPYVPIAFLTDLINEALKQEDMQPVKYAKVNYLSRQRGRK